MAMPKIQPRGTTARVAPATGRTTVGKTAFAYKPPSAEELKERAQRRGSRDSFFAQHVNFFTPKVGPNILRILPPPASKRDEWRSYGVELFIHYGIGTDEAGYLCLDKMKGEPCPICEERTRAKAAGEDEYAAQLRPNTRVSVYIIDRDQEGKGPLVWNMPQSLDADICGLAVNKKTGEIYAVDDPEAGFDISFNREGQGMITKYKAVQIDRERSPLSEDPASAAKWLEYVVTNPLDDQMIFYTYDHIKAAFAGTPHSAPAEGTTTTAVAPRSSPAAPGGRVRLRGAAATAETAPAPSSASQDTPPTWEEMQSYNLEQLGEVGAVFGLDFPDEAFESEDQVRTWVCEQLKITPPKVAPAPAAAKGNWRDRLSKM